MVVMFAGFHGVLDNWELRGLMQMNRLIYCLSLPSAKKKKSEKKIPNEKKKKLHMELVHRLGVQPLQKLMLPSIIREPINEPPSLKPPRSLRRFDTFYIHDSLS